MHTHTLSLTHTHTHTHTHTGTSPLHILPQQIRLQIQGLAVAEGAKPKYTGMLPGLGTIVREEGIGGLYVNCPHHHPPISTLPLNSV